MPPRASSKAVAALALAAVAAMLALWFGLRATPGGSSRSPDSREPSIGADADTQAGPARERSTRDALGGTRRGGELRVRAVDERGEPLPRVALALVDASSSRDVGTTDAAGTRAIEVASGSRQRLVATLDGFARLVRPVPAELPGEITLHLRRVATISGRVLWKDTGELASGARVYAFLDGYEPSPAEVRAALDGRADHTLELATAGADGRYTLDGLASGRRYTVRAVTSGAMTVSARVGARPPAQDVDIELAAFFAARVVLRELGGGPLRTSEDVWGPGISMEKDDPAVRALLGPPPELAFLVRSLPEPLESPHVLLALFTAPSRAAAIGPLRYEIDVAGYEHASATISIPAVGDALPEHVVELRPRAEGWGRLRILCRGGFGAQVAIDTSDPTRELLGALYLDPPDGDSLATTSIVLRKPYSTERIIDGIPFGAYRGSFQPQGWVPTSETSEQRVDFRIGREDTTVSLRLGEAGALEVHLIDSEGEEYGGEATLRIYARGADAYVSFRRAPYMIDGLEPGTYRVALQRLPGIDAERVLRAEATVVADRTASATLRIGG